MSTLAEQRAAALVIANRLLTELQDRAPDLPAFAADFEAAIGDLPSTITADGTLKMWPDKLRLVWTLGYRALFDATMMTGGLVRMLMLVTRWLIEVMERVVHDVRSYPLPMDHDPDIRELIEDVVGDGAEFSTGEGCAAALDSSWDPNDKTAASGVMMWNGSVWGRPGVHPHYVYPKILLEVGYDGAPFVQRMLLDMLDTGRLVFTGIYELPT